MSKHRLFGLALVLSFVLGLGWTTGSEPRQEGQKADPNQEARELAFEQLNTAYHLIGYARRNKSPLSLVTAVDILHQTPAGKFDGKIEGGEAVSPEEEAKSLSNLLDEAAKMGMSDKNLSGLIEEMRERIKEKARPIVPELGRPPLFTRQFTGSFTFLRSYVPPSGRLTVSNMPGAGLVKDWTIRVRITRGNVQVANTTFTLTFANPSRNVNFNVAQAGQYTFQITNLTKGGGSPRLAFNMVQ